MIQALRASVSITCFCTLFLLASCDSVGAYRVPDRGPGRTIGHGPPAHAQAHGYRRKQVCGYELVFDSVCGVYVVVGMSDCYYHDDHFYRLCSTGWEISLRPDADWRPVVAGSLPSGLRGKGSGRLKVSTRGKGQAKKFAKGKF